MTVSTAFPTLIDRIVTRLQAASSLSGVRIFDGAEVDFSYPKDAVAIGHDGSIGDTDIQAGSMNNDPLNFGDDHLENGVINCSLWAQDGSTDLKTRRVRAFALLSAVDTAIRTAATFSGACFYAILSSNTVRYEQTPQGSAVVIDFSITYQAQS